MNWKIVRIITLFLLLCFVGFVLYNLYDSLTYSGNYPYPTIAGDVFDWKDRFFIGVFFLWPFYTLPLIADIVLLIVSCFKLRSAVK